VRGLIERLFQMAESEPDAGPVELLGRTQIESERRAIEQIIGDAPVKCENPLGWCRELLDEIAARAQERKAAEYQRQAARTDGLSREEQDRVLMAQLEAKREAQRRRGKLGVSSSS